MVIGSAPSTVVVKTNMTNFEDAKKTIEIVSFMYKLHGVFKEMLQQFVILKQTEACGVN